MTHRERERLRIALTGWLADAALAAGGVDNIERGATARRLMDAGLGRTAAYDWIARAIDSGDVLREAEARQAGIVALASGIAAPAAEDDDAPESAVVTRHPRAGGGGGVVALGSGAIPMLAHLQRCIADVEAVRNVALHPDGRVRNARLMLQAAEALRKSLETALRLQQAMADLASLEKFHRAIIDVITKESPELAQRVLRRLDDLAAAQLGEAA